MLNQKQIEELLKNANPKDACRLTKKLVKIQSNDNLENADS